jgi:hypothetical protein
MIDTADFKGDGNCVIRAKFVHFEDKYLKLKDITTILDEIE